MSETDKVKVEVCEGGVVHRNKRIYRPGKRLDIPPDEAERLISKGVVKEVRGAPEQKGKEPPEGTSPPGKGEGTDKKKEK